MNMHRMLADLLSAINALLAVVIVLLGAASGYQWAKSAGENLTFGAGMGLVAGLVAAAIICGLLAIASLIERHLRLIADDVEEMRARGQS
ncbi:hypothetical protein [Mesorhizobium marinum]|uniref:hypothetical protein n=1 Tax=Mesorhizobium marinum TaxID=3228790 RepID=UPI0034673C67